METETEIMDLVAYVNQGRQWLAADGMKTISGMTPDHRGLAARWLENNATGIILVFESRLNEDIHSGTATLADVVALMNQRPREWITTTPLYRALTS